MGGVGTALWLDPSPPKRAQLTVGRWPPKILLRLTHGPPEVIRTQNSAKPKNGIFRISVSRGFRKYIICHVFGEEKKRLTIMPKKNRRHSS